MARADSTIRVNIIGDAKSFGKEMDKATGKLGGLGKVALGIGIGVATDQLLDFGQTALNEADRAGDALTRLKLQIGDLADPLNEAADDFVRMGQSRQDILELEAAFADIATSAQLGAPDIATFADEAAATAAAIALLGDDDAATVIEQIGRAGAGSSKAMLALGISVTDAEVEARALATTGKDTADSLTAGELAAARYALVLEALKPRLDAVADGSGDVEQKQAELQARWETLTGRIGEGLEGPLNDFLAWTLAGIDGLERLDEFLGLVEQGFRDVLGPVARFADGLRTVLGLLASIGARGMLPAGATPFSSPAKLGGTGAGRSVIQTVQDYQERNGQPII